MAVRRSLVLVAALIGLLTMADIYGPQPWSAGTFSQTGASSDPSTPDGNYPEIIYKEDVETVNASGPSGERTIDAVGGDYAAAALTIAAFGPNSGYWDATGGGQGVFYEGDFKFSSAADAATFGFNYPFTFGVRRTSPSIGYSEVFALRADLGGGQFFIAENGSEGSGFGSISADDQWHTIKVFVKPSSDNGTTPDGVITVWLDGVQIYTDTTSLIFVPSFGGNPASGLNFVNHGRYGLLPTTNFHIYTVDAGIDIATDESTPCCGDRVDPTSGGSVGDALGENRFQALQPWTPSCAGGGTVPTASDLTDAEDWSV